MSFASAAIRQAIRDVMESTAGSVRTLQANVFRGGLHTDLPEGAQRAKALLCQHSFDVKLTGWRIHGASPATAMGSYSLKRVDVTVTITTKTQTTVQEDARDDMLAALASDCDEATQALGYPGNLDTDAAGNPTGLVSGVLQGPGDERHPTWQIVEENWEAQRIRSTITGTAIVRVQQDVATTAFMDDLFGSANVALWHRATEGVSADGDGLVSQWNDLSVNTNESIQLTTDRRPTRVTGGQAGRAYVQIGNSPRAYLNGTHTYALSNVPLSVYVLGRFRAVTLGGSLQVFAFFRSNGSLACSFGHSSSGNYTSQTVNTTIGADTSFHLWAIHHNGVSTTSVAVDNGTPVTGTQALVAFTTSTFTAGSTTSGSVAPFDMYELIAIKGAVTALQNASVVDYVNARYGLEIPA